MQLQIDRIQEQIDQIALIEPPLAPPAIALAGVCRIRDTVERDETG